MSPHASLRIAFLAAIGFAASASLRADVLTLGAAHDNSIFANNVNNSAGGGPGIFAGTNGANSPRRGLISFDLTNIPAGATITNVQLTLTLGQVAGTPPSAATIGLFDLTRAWGEGTAASGASGISGSGQGSPAIGNDATWNAAFFPGTVWTNPDSTPAPGGAHATAASASLTLSTSPLDTSLTWLSTPQLVADVQGWVNNSSTNFGWELINANEVSANSVCGFYSREWSTSTFGTGTSHAGDVPALQVIYTVPEPASVSLAAIAALSLLLARPLRRRA